MKKISVLINSAILVVLFVATFTDAAFPPDDDLVFETDSVKHNQLPLIERHRRNSIFHRIKRGLFDFFGSTADESSTTTEQPDILDNELDGQQETQQFEDEYTPTDDQNPIDQNADGDYNTDYEFPVQSPPRQARASGEDPSGTEHPNAIDGGFGDDEEDLGGSGEIEGSATESDVEKPIHNTYSHPVTTEVPEIVAVTRPGPGRVESDGRTYFYRVTIVIFEPYRQSLGDRQSEEFRDLSDQLSNAIDELYRNTLRDERTRSKIIKFTQTADPMETQVSLDIESTSPTTRKVRSVFDDQLKLHTIGNINVRPEGYTFRNMQEPLSRECDPLYEIPCQSDGECIPNNERCDGVINCRDGSDESNCIPYETTTPTQDTTTITYPPPTTPGRPQYTPDETADYDYTEISPTDDRDPYGYRPGQNTVDIDEKKPLFDGGSAPFLPFIPVTGIESETPTTTPGREWETDYYTTEQPTIQGVNQIQCRGDQTILCKDGSRCFGSIQQCDGEQDCDDNSDEENCANIREDCEPGEFACDVSRCISQEQRCNFFVDCDDGSDEHDCPVSPACGSNEFRCRNGQCIPKDKLCDGEPQCYDRTDEANCQQQFDFDEQGYVLPVGELDNNLIGNGMRMMNNTGDKENKTTTNYVNQVERPGWPFNLGYCPIGRWPCRTGKQCIPVWQRCDREHHCDDMSDEDRCDETFCSPEFQWTCRNGRCIEKHLKCNGLDDCGDRSDEQTCPCTSAQFRCDNGFCIPKIRRCDKINDCQDKSDEKDCATATPAPNCGDQQYECDNGQCIDKNLVCDRYPDCADRSDERDCQPTEQVCTGDQFKCDDGTCLSGGSRCNGIRDCSNGEDESQCGCNIGEFRCMDSTCIPDNLLCDGSDDCPDGSDEGCDPCKLKISGTNDLLKCRVRLNTPLCQTYNSLFPTLESLNDLNTECDKVIRSNETAGNEESPETDNEIHDSGSQPKSNDFDRTTESVEFINLNNRIENNVGGESQDSPDKDWVYVQSRSNKGIRLEKRPKLRPMVKKLFDHDVKQCRINCLRVRSKQKLRGQQDDILEMNLRMNRNSKTIDCLEKAKNESSEENCFRTNHILTSRLLEHLNKKRITRGTKADEYFEKYKLLQRLTPASTRATTTPKTVISTTEKILANDVRTHEAFREITPLQFIYENECRFNCEKYFFKLYGGKSSEISEEDEFFKETTTQKPTGRTTTTDVTEITYSFRNNWSNEDEKSKSHSGETSILGTDNHETNDIEHTSEFIDPNNEWETVPDISKEIENRCAGKKGRREKKCKRKWKKILSESKTQSTTRKVISKLSCLQGRHYCDNSKCLDERLICNGKIDCEDRTDENDCDHSKQVNKIDDYDLGHDGSGSKNDEYELPNTRNSDLRSTTEIIATTLTNRHNSAADSGYSWGSSLLDSFLKTDDSSKSAEEKISSGSPRTTTEVSASRKTYEQETPRLFTEESNAVRENENGSDRSEMKMKVTSIETTTKILTTEKLCPEEYCDDGQCLPNEKICDGYYDCKDHTDEDDCDYYNSVIRNSFDYDEHLKNDDKGVETTSNNDVHSTDNLYTTTESYRRRTDAANLDLWNLFKFSSANTDDSKSVENESSAESSSKQPVYITTDKYYSKYESTRGDSDNSKNNGASSERLNNEIDDGVTNRPITGKNFVTERVTLKSERLKENYNAYNITFRRYGDSRRWRDRVDSQKFERQHEKLLRKQQEERKERYRAELERSLAESQNRILKIAEELKKLDNEKFRETNISEKKNPWEMDSQRILKNRTSFESTEEIVTSPLSQPPATTTEESRSRWGESESKEDSTSEKEISTTISSRRSKTTTEDSSWDWGWISGSNKRKESVEEVSITSTSTTRPETTTEYSWWAVDWFPGSDKKKESVEEKSTTSTSTVSPETTTEDPRGATDWYFGSDKKTESVEEKSTTSTSTALPETTTKDLRGRTSWSGSNEDDRPAENKPSTTGDYNLSGELNNEIPDVPKPDNKIKPVTEHSFVTNRVTMRNERKKENYNTYNMTFHRYENSRRWKFNRRPLDTKRFERMRQELLKRQKEEEEQRRMREELEQDRRRDDLARYRWELERRSMEITEELRRLDNDRLTEIAISRVNTGRTRPDSKNCIEGNRGCHSTARLIKGVADCPSMDFTCGDGSCVPQTSVCNGIDDCPLAEDELHCEKQCTVSEFRCRKDGKCINEAYRCDSTFDCSDQSDEEGCPPRHQNHTGSGPGTGRPSILEPQPTTTEGNSVGGETTETTNFGVRECDPIKEFPCKNGQCISLRRKCDFVPDCYDSSDEADCGHCNQNQWKCASEECIAENERCDGITHCVDGSDELDCVSECPTGMFQCDDGLCLDGSRHCDGVPDCRDKSDERNCSCPVGEWQCGTGACINKKFVCDNRRDCHDNSDEENCADSTRPPPPSCRGDDFQCNDGTCIPRSSVCDGRSDCSDSGDEVVCQRGCSRDEFQCRNRRCVRKEQQCDGYNDCGDNSDEDNCVPPVGPDYGCPGGQDCDPSTRCSENEWRCENGQCIKLEERCNGRRDCPRDNSDELDCDSYEELNCSPWEWRCENGPCIPKEQRCNGRRDCPRDNSDELDCRENDIPNYHSQELNLQTYPDDQIVKEKPASSGQEVVITCRDEGPMRARIRWFREDGAPLPPGSTDINGRLEMPNVQVKHAGNYVCEASGVPESTPGRRKVAHLTVEKYEAPTEAPPRSCEYDEATCSNGACISKSQICDRRYDCPDGSDERRCGDLGCEPNQFKCANKECVSKVWRCDGDKDCADGSDEENCTPPPPGSACQYNEYQCADKQCILKSFHCDREPDCLDGSDEIGCTKVQILSPPPRLVNLVVGETFTITCTALGIPIPEISWRLNWGHIPSKCTTTSYNGTGTLTCPSIAIEDQGAYSCEGMNTLGWQFAVPDTILKVETDGPNVCLKGTFNSLARTPDECISCFCFGVATECASADLFTYQIPAPFDQHIVISVETDPEIVIRGEPSGNSPDIRPIGRNGVKVTDRYPDFGNTGNVLYFALPESYHGSQLKSYGGYLKYTVRYGGRGNPNSAPSVILTGNNYVLVHKGEDVAPDYETERTVRFFFGDWVRKQGWEEVTASREEIMMALADVDNILIKVEYNDGPIDTTINNILMDTANAGNNDQGVASFVEECRCPIGYSGLSCEHCASGYTRRDNGRWLGQCYKDEPTCPPGYYQDPSRNIPCQLCPCPLTDPSNQFARTCHLGSDGQPTCDCPQGYLGRRCETCAPGYQGNPLISGSTCRKVEECDPLGSLSPYADPATGACRCKLLATGRTCNKCKANTFNLAQSNKLGCVSCFCMGITSKCTSSNWYRNEIRVAFTSSIRDFSLVESRSTDPSPIVDGIHLNKIDREIVYTSFPNRENNDVYYWQLPSSFLGDQIASYGGNLQYTVRYVPTPGGERSRNSAADVELISSNDINLRHYSRKQPEPNTAETFTVPLTEDYWQRSDGTIADREHLLMALADVQAIRIKATYTTHTKEAALSSVSLDTAVSTNTGRARAVEVEECSCPAGYRGLSCEDCDVGYTRGDQGLYLGMCVPCNCNGHSSQCDPESGVCEYCRDHTTGDDCEECEDGYEGDATQGTPQDCRPRDNGTYTPCSCDPAGSLGSYCANGQCQCKTNVEGPSCNRCRQSTFGLSANNVEGCTECFCSGVTNQCHESSYFINQIPTIIFDASHGFTLTDFTRRDVITEGFDINTATNEIGYRYPDSRSQRLFWSLPSVVTGNQVKSYGGNLYITQHISTRPGAQSVSDQDVLLIGNGITLFWTNSQQIQPDTPLVYSVPLVESAWTRLMPEEGLRRASRTDLMSVLANLEAILVRATHSSGMTATYISDVSLDTAVPQQASSRRATQVEACRCPPGYTGSSCELCTTGHYRDVNDKSRSILGACNICPCNGNEQKCELDRYSTVKCHCLPGFTGYDCSEFDIPTTTDEPTTPTPLPKIIVTIRETPIQIVEVGNTVRYHCTGQSEDNELLSFQWQKESGQLPPDRSFDDARGLLIIRDVKISDSGVYVCQVSDGVNIGRQKLTLTVGSSTPTKPRAVIEPRYLEVKEGNPAEFTCVVSGNPAPQTSWIRVQGEINPAAVFENNVWKLASVRKSDEAEYKCIAQNSAGTSEIRTILYVTANPVPPPGPPAPIIDPADWVGGPTDTVRLECSASRNARITWSRLENIPLPSKAIARDGVLTIYNPTPEDSGYYICTVTTYEGLQTSSNARVTIEAVASGQAPIVRIEPDRQTVSRGTVAEVKCIVTGQPTPTVTWSKLNEPALGSHIQIFGTTLRIINPQVSDRGIYVCHASNSGGDSQGSAVIEVERREPPVLELYPSTNQAIPAGGSTLLQCRAIEGIPTPTVKWARDDGRPFSKNVEELAGGVLRLTQVSMEDGGSYVCSASNEVGTTSSIIVLEISSRPVITITPSNSAPLTVKLGQRVKLQCSATGQPQPSVTWFKNKGIVPEDGTQRRLSATAIYEISSVSREDEGSYTCRATNDYGQIDERIQLRVEGETWPGPENPIPVYPGPGPSIPKDIFRIPDGGRVVMRCAVDTNDEEDIYINWRRNDGLSLPRGSTVSEGTLSINTVTKADAGVYICEGLSSNGYVLFNATSILEIISPPRIELDPVKQIVRPGDSPRVICRVTGDQPINIQWTAMDRRLPASVSESRGVLQFNGITYADAGKYVCTATNNAGTAETVAEVFVEESQPGVPADLRDHDAYVGSSVQLNCSINSRSTIEWTKENGEIPSNSYRVGNILELFQVKPEDSGRYICRVINENGASSRSYINLRVHFYGVPCGHTEFQCRSGECIDRIYLCDGAVNCYDQSDEVYCSNRNNRHYPQRESARATPTAPVTMRIRASHDLVNIGDTIDIQCDASGARDARIRWTKPNESSLPPNAQDYGSVIRLLNVVMSDSGIYRCTAETSDGVFEKDYELIIQGGNNDEPAVETNSAPYGSRVEMYCRVPMDPPVKFQWHKLGGRLPTNSRTSENQLQLLEVKAEDAGTYICTASNGKQEVELPQVLVVTGVVPNFSQATESYISFPPLSDASLQFNIEISFKPLSYDGIILYNGQFSNGVGDFLLLALVNGVPEFRFDLGSSPAIIRGQRPVTLGQWHTIKLQRQRKEGTMWVDGEGPYTGIAAGRFQTLDLSEPLYVGGVPDYNSINSEANIKSGFVGCISKLVIGETQLDLVGDPLLSVGITSCETCAENQCSNNGVCQEAATDNGFTCLCPAGYSGKLCNSMGQRCSPDSCGVGTCYDREDGFVCSCPLGKAGQRCELDINVEEPAFHDRGAYLAFDTPKALRKLKLAMKIKPSDAGNGILMYCSQSNDGLGDFIALIIKDRHVEFRFDSGSGMAVVRSNHVIQPGVWLNLQASRDAREGKLSINDEPQVSGRSPSPIKSMTLNTLLYIGGINRNKITLNKNVGVERNFRGCISELDIAGQPIEILKSVVDSSNIKNCIAKSNQTDIYYSTQAPPRLPPTTQFDPCSSNPCVHGMCQVTESGAYACLCEFGYVGYNCESVLKQCELLTPCKHGGTCTDIHGGYKCDCPLGFNGQQCEISVEIASDVAFRGDGWLEIDRSIMTHEDENELLGFEISTNKSSGLIMWHGQTPSDLNPDDYISLAVVDGYIEYQYNLGSGPAVIRVTAQRIDDGERHRIVLKREGSDGSIELNNDHMESGVSGGLQQLLNARGSVYLGGVPDYAMTYGRYSDGFSGCIYALEVQDSGAITIGDKAIRGKNVYPCTSEIDRPPIRGDGGHVQK